MNLNFEAKGLESSSFSKERNEKLHPPLFYSPSGKIVRIIILNFRGQWIEKKEEN